MCSRALSRAADKSAVAADAPRELSIKATPEDVGVAAETRRADALASGRLVAALRRRFISLECWRAIFCAVTCMCLLLLSFSGRYLVRGRGDEMRAVVGCCSKVNDGVGTQSDVSVHFTRLVSCLSALSRGTEGSTCLTSRAAGR